MTDQARATAVLTDVQTRLVRLVDTRTYRFKNTHRRDAERFLAARTLFRGASERAVLAREQAVGGHLPLLFRTYLLTMGAHAGELLEGSDLGVHDHAEFREVAQELLAESDPALTLPAHAEVFLLHQGYSFSFVVADGGYDGPVFAFTEGDTAITQQAGSFEALLQSELAAREATQAISRKNGRHYVTVSSAGVELHYPPLATGERPVDKPDRFLRDWRFWRRR